VPGSAGKCRLAGLRRPLNLLASRASSLGRLRLAPHPPRRGPLVALLRRDDSRGGGALRFGARYGSSDSLPTARAPLPLPPPLS